jgi:hypothetical protein
VTHHIMSSRLGSKVSSLIIACVLACIGTAAFANAVRTGSGGFTPVSEELRGNARTQGEPPVRTNSIRSDINRYNAERSTRAPVNPGESNRQTPEFRSGYQPN